ncbi:MAG: FAD:protein FMN transferase [Armatimonadota bacterium]
MTRKLDVPKPSVLLSADAMATRFEIAIYDNEDPTRLRAAAENAVNEILLTDKQLNRFKADSDIYYINSFADKKPVKVEPQLFEILLLCKHIYELSNGMYDITITPLMNLWLMNIKNNTIPNDDQIIKARDRVGMSNIVFDEKAYTIEFIKNGMMIDLGSVGKGIAIERAIEALLESGVRTAFIHGGTSSASAIGNIKDSEGFKVAIRNPFDECNETIKIVSLNDSSLSVSACHGRCFVNQDGVFGHIINPLTGQPIKGANLSAVIGASPIICEVLSTALLAVGESFINIISDEFTGYSGYIV